MENTMKTFADRALEALMAPENQGVMQRFERAFNNAAVDAFGDGTVVPAELVTGLVAGVIVTMCLNLAAANPQEGCTDTDTAIAFAHEVVLAAGTLLNNRERRMEAAPATVTTH
jgi:hypothetical protein